MIGMLTGTIALRGDTYLLIDVQGVGYKVTVPRSVSAKLESTREHVRLYTHTYVRDDALDLYGFQEPEDLRLFEQLISVSGIGCRSAIGIFSVGTRNEIIDAIVKNDVQFFTTVPRLGKKNAQKIIIELKGKVGGEGDVDFGEAEVENREVLEALKSFGYTSKEAFNALRGIKGERKTVEEKLRLVLKYLGK